MSNTEILLNRDELQSAYSKYKPILQSVLLCIENKLKLSLKMESVPSYKARVKSFNSFYKKLLRIQPPSLGKQEMPVFGGNAGFQVPTVSPVMPDYGNQLSQIISNPSNRN